VSPEPSEYVPAANEIVSPADAPLITLCKFDEVVTFQVVACAPAQNSNATTTTAT
jgi:hypothetical protein